MKNCFKIGLAALALTGLSGAAHADLSISGAVGLPLNPTAQIPEEGGARIQGNYFKLGSGVKDYGLLGATRISDKFELSGGYTKLDDKGSIFDKSGFAIGAKYLITRETDPAGVRFAVGASYDRALAKDTTVYAVASKYLGAVSGEKVPVIGHLGIRYDNYDLIDSNKTSVFAGVEVPVISDGTIQAVGEIGSKNAEGGDTPYSASLRYRPKGQPFGASVGIAKQGLSNKSGLFVQVGYTFGKK